KMLKHLSQISQPIDRYTGQDKYTNLYIIQNPIVSHNQIFQSNLGGERADERSEVSGEKPTKTLTRKLTDFFGVSGFLLEILQAQRKLKGKFIAKFNRIKPLIKYHK
ncbi:MAG: hypothetical protein HAW58_03780, partial [Candidatus Thioglobus sp.]|nr:hypothetical protein [Candidatus Thioglobus sp.]